MFGCLTPVAALAKGSLFASLARRALCVLGGTTVKIQSSSSQLHHMELNQKEVAARKAGN